MNMLNEQRVKCPVCNFFELVSTTTQCRYCGTLLFAHRNWYSINVINDNIYAGVNGHIFKKNCKNEFVEVFDKKGN